MTRPPASRMRRTPPCACATASSHSFTAKGAKLTNRFGNYSVRVCGPGGLSTGPAVPGAGHTPSHWRHWFGDRQALIEGRLGRHQGRDPSDEQLLGPGCQGSRSARATGDGRQIRDVHGREGGPQSRIGPVWAPNPGPGSPRESGHHMAGEGEGGPLVASEPIATRSLRPTACTVRRGITAAS